jgi:predicted enzyme related to lactoylglutathione lyase
MSALLCTVGPSIPTGPDRQPHVRPASGAADIKEEDVVNPRIGWFEIKVTDVERAKAFYTAVFGVTPAPWDDSYTLMMTDAGAPAFGLIKVDDAPPTDAFLNPTWDSEDLEADLALIASVGGSVDKPRELISEEFGWWGLARDPFGNYLALATTNPPAST